MKSSPGSLENRLQVAIFALFLALPLLEAGLRLDPAPAPHQLSNAARPAPPGDLDSLAAWPDAFDAWYRENFGWRAWLIRRFHQLNYVLFRVSEADQVAIGEDGWLYYGGTARDYQHRPFTDHERRRWFGSLRRRHAWLAERGIHYLFTVAPNKHSIYPEHLPAELRPVAGPSRWEELLRALEQHSDVTVVDLHAPLRAAKLHEPVYERTGSHWNARGAYLAYGEIFEQLSRWFPQLEQVPWERVQMAEQGPADLARMIGLERLLPEPRPGPAAGVRYADPVLRRNGSLVTEQDDPSLPRAVIFLDSFGARLVPYLAEHFSYAVFQWRARFDGKLVERVRPDVVIEQRVERRLVVRAIPNDFPRRAAAD